MLLVLEGRDQGGDQCRGFEAHDRLQQMPPGTPPSPPSEALPLSRLAFST